jgi:hypothetical protein
MTITARELARQQRQARKQRERDARKADRERLRTLRASIRAARVASRERRHEVVVMCRSGRQQARELAKSIRARKRAEAIAEIEAVRSQSRSTCETRKVQAREGSRDALQRAATALAAEREHQALLRRWENPPELGPRSKRSGGGRVRAELAAESDSEVEHNISPELVPVFRRVRARIKSSPRRTRTEAFLEWAQSHPADVLAIVDAQLQRDVDRLIAEEKKLRQQVVKPSTYSRASDADLLRRYESYSGAPEVPF